MEKNVLVYYSFLETKEFQFLNVYQSKLNFEQLQFKELSIQIN